MRLIKERERQTIEQYSPDVDMSDRHIPENENQGISDLKMMDTETFFFWYLALS